MPGVQLGRRIGAQQEGEFEPGLPLAQLSQGVDRVGRTGPIQLGQLDGETGGIGQGEHEHGGPVLGRRAMATALERLLPGRDEPQSLQAQRLPGNLLEAIKAFDRDPLARDVLGPTMHGMFSRYKQDEWQRFHDHVTEWEQAEYLRFY